MDKLEHIRQEIAARQADAILISRPANLSYLLDFPDYEGLLLLDQHEQYLYTDGRFFTQLKSIAPEFKIIDRAQTTLKQLVRQTGIKTLIIEPDYLNVSTFRELEQPDWHIIDSSNLVEKIRMIKTPAEIAKVQQAAQIADQVFTEILNYIKPGVSELAIANEMEYLGKKLGASATSFPTIVASGVRSAMPHGSATNKLIAAHELVVLDFGFVYQGYDSDMTRTIAVGNVEPELQNIYQIVLQAQQATINQIQLQQPLAAIDAFAHDYIARAGYGPEYMHGTGHSVGRECHEYPTLNAASVEKMPANMTFTIEPGIYLPNQGGVRLEDDLYLDEQGQVQMLTQSSKEWLEI